MPVFPPWVWSGTISAVCGFAVWKGRGPERVTAVLVYLAWILSWLVHDPDRNATEWAIFGVDTVLFVLLLAVALTSDRYWPIFAAGFELLSVVTHLGRMADPAMPHWAYHTAAEIWGYLTLLALTVGTVNRWRERREARAISAPADHAA